MRFAVAFLVLSAAAACAAKEEATPDSAAPAVAATPSVADFAGSWQLSTVLEGAKDTVKSTVNVMADGSCSLVLEGRPNISCTTSMSGDSLVVQTSEYESILRKGVMTSVRSAAILMNQMMHGNLVSSYKMPNGEQKVAGTFTGTKAP